MCLRALKGVIGGGLIGCLLASSVVAAPLTAQDAQNNCVLFYSLQKGSSFKVVKVDVLDAENGVVSVRILGLPNKVSVTLNGMDMGRQKVDSQQIKCGREVVGEISSYDLRSLNIDAGYFQVYAGGFTVGKSVSLR